VPKQHQLEIGFSCDVACLSVVRLVCKRKQIFVIFLLFFVFFLLLLRDETSNLEIAAFKLEVRNVGVKLLVDLLICDANNSPPEHFFALFVQLNS
jgi:hypothetical protein